MIPRAPAAPATSLAAALATIPDPRRPRGWNPRYPPAPAAVLLQFCVAAMLCGARSLYAIAQWGREMRREEPALLTDLWLPPGSSPCVATLHRLFKALDVAAIERVVGAWLRQAGVPPTDPVAIDGKTLRGIHGEAMAGAHLEAVSVTSANRSWRQGATTCFPSKQISRRSGTTSSAPFPPLLAQSADLATGPCLERWEQQEWQARGARLTIAVDAPAKPAHGRLERRFLWVLADPAQNVRVGDTGEAGTPWPHVHQLCRLERWRINPKTGELRSEVTLAVASLRPEQADAARLLALSRGHWRIENRLHYVRDMAFDEDHCTIRTGAAPQLVAACRNLALALLRQQRCPNIAAALRRCAWRPRLAVRLVLRAGVQR